MKRVSVRASVSERSRVMVWRDPITARVSVRGCRRDPERSAAHRHVRAVRVRVMVRV